MPYKQIQDPVSNPSPFTLINVFNPFLDDKQEKDVRVIADTGSGRTFLPKIVIRNLELSIYSTVQVRSPLEKRIIDRNTYLVRLELNGRSYQVEVTEIQKPYGIIGRDILNDHKIVLDPQNEQWGFDCRWNHETTCGSNNCISVVS